MLGTVFPVFIPIMWKKEIGRTVVERDEKVLERGREVKREKRKKEGKQEDARKKLQDPKNQ